MLSRPASLPVRPSNLVRSIPFRQSFSTQSSLRSAHGDHYNPPSGWLFGVKPGQKYIKEGWENLFFYGVGGSVLVTAVAYAFKPDTSIQTWALEEARRRLEKEGILEDSTATKE